MAMRGENVLNISRLDVIICNINDYANKTIINKNIK